MRIEPILFISWTLSSSVIASNNTHDHAKCNLSRPSSFLHLPSPSPLPYHTVHPFPNPKKLTITMFNPSELEQNRLAIEQMPSACSLPACIGLTGTITCIVSAVTSGDAAALERCISDGLVEVFPPFLLSSSTMFL